ncbi:TatD family hydrolase [Patescibacteria group bacterium]|nr:TatD family hydrolase [Patescibacteria group bacterium]
MLIDTHAHLDFPQFNKDREKVIQRTQKAGIKVINVSSHLDTCQKAINLAQKYEGIWAAVGVHPHYAEEIKNQEKLAQLLKKLAKNPKVVGIGECGLDYHESANVNNEKQKELFQTQLRLVQELKLPVIIHCREAFQDTLQIIKPLKLSGVFHCFSGDNNFLEKVLALGFYVGFDGNVTFKNAPKLQELAKLTPLNRLLVETDCPFLAPEPHRGTRSEPAHVKIIAECLAKLKGVSLEEVAKITTKNAKNLFKI